MSNQAAEEILRFWFGTLTPEDWYRKDPKIDAEIRERFGKAYEALSSGVPEDWLSEPRSVLAAIIVLDQFPRNMFRNDPRAFATDPLALALAKHAIGEGMDMSLPPEQRAFVYMPFQHSEDAQDQARSVELFTQLGDELNLDFARRHQVIVERFGRFPHRNVILGRASTEEETAFLKEPGSSF